MMRAQRKQQPAVQRDRLPVNVVCQQCRHMWVAVYTPMKADLLIAVLSSLHCPMCGAGADLIVLTADKK